jgi:hypothetical protein
MKVFRSFLLVACLSSPLISAFSIVGSANKNKNVIGSTTRLSMATWSDSKAVKEYQEFLSSGEQELALENDQPSAIIFSPDGANEMAESLWAMGNGDDVVIQAGAELPLTLGGKTTYPIYITLPPNQLAYFLQNLPDQYKARYEDLVFFSGGLYYGNIEDILKENGLCRDTMTQAIMTGFVRTPSGQFNDLTTDLGVDANGEKKLAGECAVCGKWRGAIKQRLERNGIQCSTDFYRDWRRKMWERHILDAVFNLVGSVRKEPTSLANVAMYYGQEVSEMVWEISQQLRGWKAMSLTYGFEERIFGIAENTGAEQQCVVLDEAYEWIWGNKVFTDAPTYLEYLWYAKDTMGLLQTVQLPPKLADGEGVSTKMRSGNLRADGVV